MVSFQAPIFSDSRSKPNSEFDHLSKRKREDVLEGEETFNKRSKPTTKSIFDMDLHLENPLPLEWERCLDIQVYMNLVYIHLCITLKKYDQLAAA